MKVLQNVAITAEQLAVVKHAPGGMLIIRGAAGSGKTTTALLRLRVVVDYWHRQLSRTGRRVNCLVLTFNRTLAGYIDALAHEQATVFEKIDLEVTTFASWARRRLGGCSVLDLGEQRAQWSLLGESLGLPEKFLHDEVEYVRGRFLPAQLGDYLTLKREGRGTSPQMPRAQREKLLRDVIRPYEDWKRSEQVLDWNDLAVELARQQRGTPYDVVVVDETQDFQANQLRALIAQLSTSYSATFVLDSAQRIYPHFFRWNEVGVVTAPPGGAVVKLSRNHRNTRQIAAFAAPIIEGVEVGPDGTMPDLASATSSGPLPYVLRGRFSAQMNWAVGYLQSNVDLDEESVCFLHAKGGGWFREVKSRLRTAGIAFHELSREADWPTDATNIGLCTMHSAKGLEFDHVIILGLNREVTPHGEDEGDADLETLRRLFAMAAARAKRGLVIGYKPQEASRLVSLFREGTYMPVDLR